jgi:chemotaxis protein CheC
LDIYLNEVQLDALREVGNIGAGNAATALSQMINRRVNMAVPQIDILEYDEMLRRVGKEDDLVVAVLLKVLGDAPGSILFVINLDKAQELSKQLLQGFSEVSEEIYMSVFQEIGNILGNSYLIAITKITGLNLLTTVPAVAVDMLSAVLSTCFIDAEQFNDYILAIDTNFIDSIEGIDEFESGGFFFYIPRPGSLNKILTNLGLE